MAAGHLQHFWREIRILRITRHFPDSGIPAVDPVKEIFGRQDFPDLINIGVLLARPGSKFVALWMDSFHKYTGAHETFHAVEIMGLLTVRRSH